MKLPLTKELLERLRSNGYAVLESDRELPDVNAILTPRRVDNMDEYLDQLDEDVMKELIVDEAMKWPERDLQGFVELPDGFQLGLSFRSQ